MTKFAKLVVVCGGLFLLVCCTVLGGCRKTSQQDGVLDKGGANNTAQSGVNSGEETLDDGVNLEIETHGTVKTSYSTAKSTTQRTGKSGEESTQKSTDGTAKGTKQSTGKSTGSTKKDAVQTADSTAEGTKQSTGKVTDNSPVTTTVPTTQKGWTPELGKKPK